LAWLAAEPDTPLLPLSVEVDLAGEMLQVRLVTLTRAIIRMP
jgi:hypothetical protein